MKASLNSKYQSTVIMTKLARLILFGCMIGLSGACGSPERPLPVELESDAVDAGVVVRDRCASPAEGCPCSLEGQSVECGSAKQRSGDYLWCALGERACTDGVWGVCESDVVVQMAVAAQTKKLSALPTPTECDSNPCDPYCLNLEDDPTLVDLPDGGILTKTPSGIELKRVPPSGGVNSVACTSIDVIPTPQELVVTGFNSGVQQPQGGSALLGEYFGQRGSSIPSNWTPDATRSDTSIDFDWGSGSPGLIGVGSNDFSVRWSGYITPPQTGTYKFYPRADDGIRLWVNGAQLVDAWVDQSPREYSSANLTLIRGQYYPFTMEYYENGGGAVAQLRWDGPGTGGKQIIAPEYFQAPPVMVPVVTGPLIVSPENAQFSVAISPADCFAGEVPAAWTVNKPGIATIDQSGLLKLFAPVAGPIRVDAYAGSFVASAIANVIVRMRDDSGVPAATAARFDGPGSGTDPMVVLYPYRDTVFPLGIRAPVVQWDKGGSNATAVRVALRYPATGVPLFSWEKITTESSAPRVEIPADVWKAFEQTAKAQDAAYVVQRLIGTSLKSEVVRPIRFATAPLRGKIVYTEYGRGANRHAYIMSADPSSTDDPKNMFSTGGCPVCHTVSANGNVFATADRSWSASGGISKVEADGSFTELSDYPSDSKYKSGANDWRGFGWAPLTPDGRYALAANNVWGNSKQSVVGISNRQVSVTSSMVSGGSGLGLRGEFFRNENFSGTPWLRTDPTIDFNWNADAPGPMPTDKFSVRWSGTVQSHYGETYTFSAETEGGVKLTVGGQVIINNLANTSNTTLSGSVALQAGQFYDTVLDYKETSGDAKLRLRWESPSTPLGIVPQTQLNWNNLDQGVLVVYYGTNNFQTPKVTRVEPQIAGNWGTSSPAPNIGTDNFSSIWTGRLQAPYTGAYTFCVDTDDDIKLFIGSTTVLSRTGNGCSLSINLVADQMYTIRAEHREFTGSAKLRMDWSVVVGGSTLIPREMIPHERLFLPTGYTHPTNGVTVTYYDTRDFNASIGSDPTSTRAVRRIEPTLDHDWGSSWREEYQNLTANTDLSARFTGTIIAPCTGVTEFELNKDDGGHFWVNGVRVASQSGSGSTAGSVYLDQGVGYEFKYDFDQGSGSADVRLRWKPCGQGSFVTVPQSAFTPKGGTTLGGLVRAGGDNASGTDYFVWQMPTAQGQAPTDVTNASAGKWGLAGTTMMVPSFAPNASKLVFVDGDQAGGAGWRKGLSTFDFDQNLRVFKNRRTLVNNWPFGEVIKWPVFESDSRSILYSASPASTHCCINDWTKYGYMAPTDYYETPGLLYSVDAEAANPVPVPLTRASAGERPIDANKAWQPTTLPVAAGGYRWMVFTSTRPYGNTVNVSGQNDYSNFSNYQPMLNYGDMQSQLWIAAVDDNVSSNADRSHPAFWLPNQNYETNPNDGYVNERGFWALEACRSVGTNAASECEVAEDCCGATDSPPTAACRLDIPVTANATKHCRPATTQDSCVLPGGECAATDECCPGTVCVGSVCAAPPKFDTYRPANFSRVYEAECRFDALGEWHFFDWKASTPATDAFIEFYIQTANDPNEFIKLPVAPEAVTSPGVLLISKVSGAQDTSIWSRADIGKLFRDADLLEGTFVQITARLSPNTELTASPVLEDFRAMYSCPPAQ